MLRKILAVLAATSVIAAVAAFPAEAAKKGKEIAVADNHDQFFAFVGRAHAGSDADLRVRLSSI
jgi:hypothetical protein